VIPPDPIERRRGVYDYLVEVPPLPVGARASKAANSRPAKAAKPVQAKETAAYTRSTPDEMGSVIRRIGGR
jgi:hypothetical protein